MVVKRIEKKLSKRYGPNTALVVRDTSGVDWDWDLVGDAIKDRLKSVQNPFDTGIWILSSAKNKNFPCYVKVNTLPLECIVAQPVLMKQALSFGNDWQSGLTALSLRLRLSLIC